MTEAANAPTPATGRAPSGRPRRGITFRAKLLASHLGLVAVATTVATWSIDRQLSADLHARLDQRLEQQAKGAAMWLATTRHKEILAGRLAAVVNARVTIMDAAGSVLGDSVHPGDTTPDMPNQGERREVDAARRGGVGRDARVDEGVAMQFVAVPAGEGLVVRLGVPLAETQETIAAMRVRLLFGSALATAAAVGLGIAAARIVSRPVRRMTETATRIAQGDYDIPVASTAPDDFGILAGALASLAEQLKAQIGTLTAQRDRLSAVLTSMVEGVLVVRKDGTILEMNPSAMFILSGQSGRESVNFEEAVTHPALKRLVEEALAGGRPAEAVLEEGDQRALAVNVRPLAQAAGGGAVAVIHDLTRLRRLETMRRDFLANVSHELRTPVTAIQGYAETLLRGTADPATQKEFLEIIHRHSHRIGRLVEDLLRLSNIETRPMETVVRETIDLAALAGNVAKTVASRTKQAAVTLAIEIGSEVRALGDPDGLEQVLENLVDNAVKYGRPNGTITISGRASTETAELRVADDGPGIAPEHLPRLFERFYRVDPGRSRDRGGNGLGLAIVKRLVESMGGEIAVESAVGAGTTFTIRLPTPGATSLRRVPTPRA